MKEWTRSTWNMLPFKSMPTQLTIKMVSASTFWWNSFPPEGGVSENLSPWAIIVGMEINFNKHCQLEFGMYLQTHEQSDNSMQSQTTGAIAKQPTGNEQGGYYFFSLTTGRRLNRNRWTELPMPSKVVDRVHFFARANEQGLSFGNRNGVPDDEDPFDSGGDSYNSDDDSDDEADDNSVDYDSDDNDDAVNNNATIPTAGVDDANNNAADNNNNNSSSDSLDSSSSGSSDKEDNNSDEGEDSSEDDDDNDSDDSGDNAGTDDAEDDNNDKNEPTADAQMSVEQAMDTQYGKRGTNHDLCPRCPRN
jgi:hypothetical protein